MAKEIERTGIPVAYVTTLTSLAEEIRANRIVAGVRIPHPVGNPLLTPENEAGVRTAVVAACSRAAHAGSYPPGPRPGTVAPTARRLPGTGDAGGLLSVTAPATTASSADGSRVNAIVNDSVRHKPSLRSPRPKASAQTLRRKKVPAARATDPAATNSSFPRGVRSSSVSVRPSAVRLYDASANVKYVLGSAAGNGKAAGRTGEQRDRLGDDQAGRQVMIAAAEQLVLAVGAQRPATPWVLAEVRRRSEGGALGASCSRGDGRPVDVHAPSA